MMPPTALRSTDENEIKSPPQSTGTYPPTAEPTVNPNQISPFLLTQDRPSLLDYLICPRQHRRRDRQADHLGSLEVDHEFKLPRLLDGKIGRFGALEDPVHVDGGAPELLRQVGPVAQQPSCLRRMPTRGTLACWPSAPHGAARRAIVPRKTRRSIIRHLRLSPSRQAIASSSTRTASWTGMTGRASNTKAGQVEHTL
jgi:hypothetical protein